MSILTSWFASKEVEFLCEKEDFGVIPEPIPARKFMPDWYKHLDAKVNKQDKLNNSTIKRCGPFLDAMTIGWIIPLAADVEFVASEDGSDIGYKWNFNKVMVENHQNVQINPENGPQHPSMPKPPMKFLNYWYIKIPKDYSALFVPPLNRPDPRFQCIPGVVDDGYMGNGALEYINFPFFFTQTNYTGIIRAGTPLVQMILIKRDGVLTASRKANLKIVDQESSDLINLTRRRRSSQPSYYRERIWKRK